MLLPLYCPPHTAHTDSVASEICSDESTRKTLLVAPPAYTPPPYMDSPPMPHSGSSPTALDSPTSNSRLQSLTFHIVSPADYIPVITSSGRPSFSSDEEDDDDEEVPLAHLLPTPYDAPPAYSSVVRQSYRQTLQQHISRCSLEEVDEEAALERVCAEELSFEVERAVAMAVVMALMMMAGVLVGLLFLRKGA
ncbi:hypothetical protein E8E13_002169 [Curvularia kusanoi]|uniref:Uncharacterized protein n=1 Tax=Curvularia kusanoi TaxID=90978 RepID=A0A9P4T8R8_CURKU|nr:hypothetical protein E8E13_002169 [Curvularia kusanoi]